MVSNDDVISAYRLFLGREPESAEVVDRLRSECPSLAQLRARFLESVEFNEALGRSPPPALNGCKPLTWPPISVEVDVGEDVLDAMVSHVEANWTRLGASEPHWSVLSDDQFLASRIAETEDGFYHSGRHALELFEAAAARNRIDLGAHRNCLELGCGLGRLTLWLSRKFAEVTGVDISPAHLELADKALRSFGRTNVRLVRLDRLATLDDLPQYDVAFSVIVLQHNPPPVIRALLERLLAHLRPGGVAYFQLSTYHLGYRFKAERYLKTLETTGAIEMHVFPQRDLFELIGAADCDLLEVREDSWAGQAGGVSNTLFVRKRGDPRPGAAQTQAETAAPGRRRPFTWPAR